MALISSRLQEVIATRPDWYNDSEYRDLHQRLIDVEGDGAELDEISDETWQFIGWFANALAENLVMLGDVRPGYNDDDRQGTYGGPGAAPVDKVIIHHSATKEDVSVWELEALGLLRLYVPSFMKDTPDSFIKFLLKTHPHLIGEPLAPVSGHYMMRDGKEVQSFVAYHYVIYPDGSYKKLLDDDHMAIQAGNYDVNASSLAIVMAGNFVHGEPTAAAQQTAKSLILSANTDTVDIKFLDTHSHVRLTGPTDCPGPWFEEFASDPELAHLKRVVMKPKEPKE